VETIGSRFGGIPLGLPHFSFPVWTWPQIKTLFPVATTIALLAAIESLLSAVVADGMIGGQHKSNLELVAQGIANIASPLFGGIPATGAIARTATNIKNGGRTPIAGLVHVLVLMFILLIAGPLAARIPLAALAGILVVVSYHMSEWRSFQFLLQTPWSDIVVLVTTFLLTVFVDLTVAVEVGMVLAAFLFMRHMAEITQVRNLTRATGKLPETEEGPRPEHLPPGVEVFTMHGTFFFGAAHKLLETLRIVARAPRALILEMTDVLLMDASGLRVLQQTQDECRRRGSRMILVGIHAQPLTVLERANLIESLGRRNLHATLADALRDLESAAPQER
jgi:SulP family sulfate permease